MVEGKGEVLSKEAQDNLVRLIESIDERQRSTQNAGWPVVDTVLNFFQKRHGRFDE